MWTNVNCAPNERSCGFTGRYYLWFSRKGRNKITLELGDMEASTDKDSTLTIKIRLPSKVSEPKKTQDNMESESLSD